jgi:hypothetical protein
MRFSTPRIRNAEHGDETAIGSVCCSDDNPVTCCARCKLYHAAAGKKLSETAQRGLARELRAAEGPKAVTSDLDAVNRGFEASVARLRTAQGIETPGSARAVVLGGFPDGGYERDIALREASEGYDGPTRFVGAHAFTKESPTERRTRLHALEGAEFSADNLGALSDLHDSHHDAHDAAANIDPSICDPDTCPLASAKNPVTRKGDKIKAQPKTTIAFAQATHDRAVQDHDVLGQKIADKGVKCPTKWSGIDPEQPATPRAASAAYAAPDSYALALPAYRTLAS